MAKTLYIIIPLYNVARYIRECLDSIMQQTYKNFVAIIVNDGSTDESATITQEYCHKDKRFVLLSQENRGLGAARNTGIEYALTLNKMRGGVYRIC